MALTAVPWFTLNSWQQLGTEKIRGRENGTCEISTENNKDV